MPMTCSREWDLLLSRIVDEAIVYGRWLLPDGSPSPTSFYIDMRVLTFDAWANLAMSRMLLDLVPDLSFDAVGGLELAAVPVTVGMMNEAGRRGSPVDSFAVRKKPKKVGRKRIVEGPDITGRRVLIVDDTCWSGNAVLHTAEVASAAGAHVVGAVVVVDRGGGERVRDNSIDFRSLYDEKHISRSLEERGRIRSAVPRVPEG